MLYNVVTISLLAFCKCLFKLEIKGKECFPKKTPFILTSNHVSNLDPIILGVSAYPRLLRFLAKEELFFNKLFAILLKDIGALPIKRHKNDIKAIRMALNILKKEPLAVFPQGTRNASFDEINPGIGFLSKKAKVPIVASKIRGTDKILPKGAKKLQKGKISIIFGRVDNISDTDDYKAIAAKVIDKIRSL